MGNYQREHVFALSQSLALYDFYQVQVAKCDQEIEGALAQLRSDAATPQAPLPPPWVKKGHSANGLQFDVREALYALLGIDLTQIHGLGPYVAVKLISECGTDMTKWPSAKHFISWLCLAPGNKNSGGKVLSSRTRRSSNRAASLLRLAATTVGRTDTPLGAFYRSLSARAGKTKAITATARKLAGLFYNAMCYGMEYADPGASYYEDRYRQRVVANLRRRAKSMGFVLQEVAAEGVS